MLAYTGSSSVGKGSYWPIVGHRVPVETYIDSALVLVAHSGKATDKRRLPALAGGIYRLAGANFPNWPVDFSHLWKYRNAQFLNDRRNTSPSPRPKNRLKLLF